MHVVEQIAAREAETAAHSSLLDKFRKVSLRNLQVSLRDECWVWGFGYLLVCVCV